MQTSARSYTRTSESCIKTQCEIFTPPLQKNGGEKRLFGDPAKKKNHPQVQTRAESEGKDGLSRKATENTALGSLVTRRQQRASARETDGCQRTRTAARTARCLRAVLPVRAPSPGPGNPSRPR